MNQILARRQICYTNSWAATGGGSRKGSYSSAQRFRLTRWSGTQRPWSAFLATRSNVTNLSGLPTAVSQTGYRERPF